MSEVIHEFTESVIELAVSDKNKLEKLGYKQPIAINLSARNLYDDSCLSFLEQALTANGLNYLDIEVELTESAIMHEPKRSLAILNLFNSKGINIAVDEPCLPSKIYLGHVDWLIDRCDFILVPRLADK